MEKPENIVANRTHWLSNRRCESSEDKVPVSESSGRTGVRASNLATALSQFCSIVTGSTRIRFKWGIKCDEPVVKRRSQYIQARRVCAPEWHFGGGEVARLQGLIGKAGKDLEQRRLMGECVMPTSSIIQGLADVVVVAVKPLIIRRKSKGPLDTMAPSRIEHRILPERVIWSRIKGF